MPKTLLEKLNLTTERVAILVLLVVLVTLVVMFVRQNRETFKDGENKKAVVNFFYVDWCPHCKTAKPEVNKFVEQLEENGGKLDGTKVEVKKINPEETDENKEKARQCGVNAYPTVVLEDNNGNVKAELETAVTKENLEKFVKEHL